MLEPSCTGTRLAVYPLAVQPCPLNLTFGFLDPLRNAWSSYCVPGIVPGTRLSNSGGYKVYHG